MFGSTLITRLCIDYVLMLCSYLFYFECLLFFYNAVLLWGISHPRLVKYKCKFNIFYVIFTFTWLTTANQESTYLVQRMDSLPLFMVFGSISCNLQSYSVWIFKEFCMSSSKDPHNRFYTNIVFIFLHFG